MSRDITKLHPYVRILADTLVQKCDQNGLKIKITDCVRTKEEQNGVDASRTNCQYPYSYHNWGLAFDFCRYEDVDNDGKISDDAYNNKDNFFYNVGQIGKSLGLDWGGDFKSIYDGPHFEYKGLGTRSQIQRIYGLPEKFFTSWVLTNPTSTITQRSSANDIMWLQTYLNKSLNGLNGFIPLLVDGKYGNKTRQAVLDFWKLVGWNKEGKDTGWKVGMKTINELNK